MRAVKDKNNYLNFISSPENRVFNKIDLCGFLSVNSMDEREFYIVNEIHVCNLSE